VVLAVLVVLLRALVAPVLLMASVVLSFLGSLGGAALLFHALGRSATDPELPLYGFLFLVALGVDYTIFLMSRAREETARIGTRDGTLRALAVTGGVITSAGVLLAATFTVLGVMPVTFMLQLGLLVGVGALLDTFVVRTMLVPALALDLDRRLWWPSRLGSVPRSAATPPLVMSKYASRSGTSRHHRAVTNLGAGDSAPPFGCNLVARSFRRASGSAWEGVVKRSEEDEFRAFVGVRMERWRRAAYLLCHDWHTADDLVAIVVGKLCRSWRRICTVDNPDAYAQRMLTMAWLVVLCRILSGWFKVINVDGTVAGGAGAGHDREEDLEFLHDGVEGQAGAGTFGSRRRLLRKAWARLTRVTWRCQPMNVRPSKWSMPRPVLSSR
jgi:hypothetical protein